jgi:hypothetical protein
MTDRTELELTLNKLAFLSFAVDEVRDTYELPTDPEDRADLLLASEDLVQSVFKLAQEINDVVWNMPFDPNSNSINSTSNNRK